MPNNWMTAIACISLGCATVPGDPKRTESLVPKADRPSPQSHAAIPTQDQDVVQPASFEDPPAAEVATTLFTDAKAEAPETPLPPEPLPPTPQGLSQPPRTVLVLDDVIGSVYSSYPLLESALATNNLVALPAPLIEDERDLLDDWMELDVQDPSAQDVLPKWEWNLFSAT